MSGRSCQIRGMKQNIGKGVVFFWGLFLTLSAQSVTIICCRRYKITLLASFFLFLSTLQPACAVMSNPLTLVNPVDLGAVVIPSGAISGTAAHYSPAVYADGHAICDSSGTISRALYQAKKYVLPSGANYAVGRLERATLSIGQAGSDVYDWIASHLLELPSVGPIFSSAIPTGSGATYFGATYIDIFGGQLPDATYAAGGDSMYYVVGSFSGGTGTSRPAVYARMASGAYAYIPAASSVTTYYQGSTFTNIHNVTQPGWYIRIQNGMLNGLYYCNFVGSSGPVWFTETGTPLGFTFNAANYSSPIPGAFQSPVFAATLNSAITANPSSIIDDIDKIIAANPGDVIGVPPWLPADTDEGWRLVHGQLDDSRYSSVPSNNNQGNPGCTSGQGL